MRRAPISAAGLVALAATALAAAACRAPHLERARDSRKAGSISDPATGTAVGAAARQPAAVAPPVASAAAVDPAADRRLLVVFLGDSLTAGYGLALDEAYPERVEALLNGRGLPIQAINAGVSGDTTAGGLERMNALLARRPAIVFIELGANDGLRGQPVDGIATNLRAIVGRARESGARVVLAGMRIPPNYGPEYTEAFAALYPALAHESGAALVPFLLAGVAGRPELNQADGIHPTAEGQSRVATTVAATLAPIVRELAAGGER